MGFLTKGTVHALSECYDCKYFYIDRDHGSSGHCVCGVFTDILVQAMLGQEKDSIRALESGNAITREVRKVNPNLCLLGFMVEHEVLAKITKNGIYMHGRWFKCDTVVWFQKGHEKILQLQDGCSTFLSHLIITMWMWF
ncbi:hypothetical protein GOP47_0003324 [Adiantum capillus-veneris]|uniref:Uncharacterized protein n=1 Tax=Adiantum capillus-veneris TaxID=13818 RepID=A0A9D4VBR7_ADICA|nr:hypothetical protein GOP47_0003324 [Adiantum capillus-veneris]